MERGHKGTVLVVDDDEAIRESLTRTLSRMGFATLRASNAGDGLDLVQLESPDIVFLDVRMEGLSGIDFLRALRKRVGSGPPSIVAMSGSATLDEIIDVIRLGAVDYIRKPWNLAEIISAVSTALDASRPTSRAREAARPTETTQVSLVASPDSERLEHLKRELASGRLPLPLPDESLRPLTILLSTGSSRANDIASTLEKHADLAPYVMRAANLRPLTASGRIVSAGPAVAELGPARLRGVVQAWSLKRFCDTPNPTIRQLLTVIWQRSVARASAMRGIVRASAQRGVLDPEEAFLVGLMADIGAMAILWAASEEERRTGSVAIDPMALLTFVRREHESLADSLLRTRSLPPSVRATAVNHHAAGDRGISDWIHLFRLGESLIHNLIPDRDLTASARTDASSLERSAQALAIEPARLQDVIRDITPEFEALRGERTWLGA